MDEKQQLLYAVEIASSPDAGLRQQANDFLREVVGQPDRYWTLAMSIFLAGAGASASSAAAGGPAGGSGLVGPKDGQPKASAEARVFALQVVDGLLGDKVRIDALPLEQKQAVEQAFLQFVETEYVEGTAEAGPVQSLMRNKLAHSLALLFIALYPSLQTPMLPLATPSLLGPYLSLLKPTRNRQTSLLLLRTLVEINEEVHDTLLKSARPATVDRSERDTKLRDEVRDKEAGSLHGTVVAVWEEALDRLDGGEGAEWTEVVEGAVKAYSGYVPWIDITLTVTPHALFLLNRLLSHAHIPFRLLALDALSRIVLKGMKDPGEKLQLLNFLAIGSALDPLERATAPPPGLALAERDEAIDVFRERMAKLLNHLGIELGKLVSPDALAEEATQREAERMLEGCLPLFLRLLGDEHPETSSAVFGFLDDILKRHKKAKKGEVLALTAEKRAFFSSLLETILKKMEWAPGADWSLGEDDGEVDPDEVATFQTLRRQLKTALEAVANFDPELFVNALSTVINGTLERFQAQGPSAVSWQQAELALFLVYSWSEFTATKVSGRGAFIQIPADVQAALDKNKLSRKASFTTSAQQAQAAAAAAAAATAGGGGGGGDSGMTSGTVTPTPKLQVDYTAFPLTVQGEILLRTVRSELSSYPHPSVALQFFECASRYAEFFKMRTDLIGPTLGALLDPRGIHSPRPAVQERAFYLFHKFIRDLRGSLDASLVPQILSSMNDLLAIKPVIPERETPEEDLLQKAATMSSPFDAQLYLFETVGTLIWSLGEAPDQQRSFLEAAVNPLLAEIANHLQRGLPTSADDLLPILTIHHAMMAIGNVAKGFPEPTEHALALPSPPWVAVFKQSTEALLAVLDRLNTVKAIREAARFAFARIVATASTRVLEYVALFVKGIVAHFESSELVEFLGFLGLVLHKLKGDLLDVLDGLVLPIIQKVFQILAEPVQGTDDELAHTNLRAAYLSFLASIMGARLDAVFLSPTNKPELENILTNVASFTTEYGDPICQKLAFSILARTVVAWAFNPSVPRVALAGPVYLGVGPEAKILPTTQVIPGFEAYIYDRLMPLCFEVPSNAAFRPKDGQSQLVMAEIATLFRSIVFARGQEALDRLQNAYLPSLGCPPETAADFVTQLTTLESKNFRRWFTDFVKSARDAQEAAQKAARDELKEQQQQR